MHEQCVPDSSFSPWRALMVQGYWPTTYLASYLTPNISESWVLNLNSGSASCVSSTSTGEEKERVAPASRVRRQVVRTEYTTPHSLTGTLATSVLPGSSTSNSTFSVAVEALSCNWGWGKFTLYTIPYLTYLPPFWHYTMSHWAHAWAHARYKGLNIFDFWFSATIRHYFLQLVGPAAIILIPKTKPIKNWSR